jgi:hypothetical protein
MLAGIWRQKSKADLTPFSSQNIRKKLGADIDTSSPISEKPKNMHWKTFNRLRQESYAASDQSWGIIGQRYGFYRM